MSGEEVKIPVKLFVSKFPASFSEDELRQVCSSHYFIFIVLSKVFTPFGELESLVILKQKDPSRPQSCGFVRFASISDAIRAIRELNGKHMIDPNIGPLNVEYASGEAERLNLPSTAEGTSVKLFIGGVPLAMSDEELRDYFSEFGQVTECHVLAPKIANPAVQTKAAFVRFARKADALTAIEKLDKKVPFPGVERPMDVRIAENRNESKPDDRMPYTTRPGAYQQPQRGYAQPSMGYQAQPQRALPGSMVPPAAPMRTPRTIGVWTEFHAPDGRPYYHNTVTNVTSWDPPVEFRLAGPPAPPPPMYHTGMPAPTQSSPEAKGPAGSNLFVFHVPADWSEAELYGQFAPFGNVIGYRIARERETGRPKGFGFVSFDNPGSAQAAMGSLNGIIVSNGKRLKVSLKKGEEGYAAGPMTYAAPY